MDALFIASLTLLLVGAATQKVAVQLNVATDLLIYGPLLVVTGLLGLAVSTALAALRLAT